MRFKLTMTWRGWVRVAICASGLLLGATRSLEEPNRLVPRAPIAFEFFATAGMMFAATTVGVLFRFGFHRFFRERVGMANWTSASWNGRFGPGPLPFFLILGFWVGSCGVGDALQYLSNGGEAHLVASLWFLGFCGGVLGGVYATSTVLGIKRAAA